MDETLALSLLENRRKKREALSRLLSLTGKQKLELENNELEKVSETSDSWHDVASQVEALDAYFEEHVGQLLGEEVAPEEQKVAEELQELAEQNAGILEQIHQLHQQNNILAEQMMQTSRGELKNMQRNNERMQGYLNPFSPGEGGTYFDQKK